MFTYGLRAPLALVLAKDEEGLGLGVVGQELHPGVPAPVPPLPVGRLRLDQHEQVRPVETQAARVCVNGYSRDIFLLRIWAINYVPDRVVSSSGLTYLAVSLETSGPQPSTIAPSYLAGSVKE